MSVIANRNTAQTPMTGAGLTGGQVLKFIDAPRVYTKASDTTPTLPATKSNGSTPAGWTDLGIVEGKVKVGVEKKVKEIKTGIDNYFRAAYTNDKTGTLEFSLTQFDDITLQQIAGWSTSNVNYSVVTAGSIVTFAQGSEDLNQQAILLVQQNKLDGKEVQFYSPNAYINFSFEDSGDQMMLKVNCLLPFFVLSPFTKEQMLATTIFA